MALVAALSPGGTANAELLRSRLQAAQQQARQAQSEVRDLQGRLDRAQVASQRQDETVSGLSREVRVAESRTHTSPARSTSANSTPSFDGRSFLNQAFGSANAQTNTLGQLTSRYVSLVA